MSLMLMKYEEIMVRNLPKVRDIVQEVIDEFGIPPMTTELMKYENHIYFKIDKSTYVGFMMPSLITPEQMPMFGIPVTDCELWAVRGLFVTPYYQGIGIEQKVYEDYFKDRYGLMMVSEKQYELKAIIKELGFWNVKDDIYINLPCY